MYQFKINIAWHLLLANVGREEPILFVLTVANVIIEMRCFIQKSIALQVALHVYNLANVFWHFQIIIRRIFIIGGEVMDTNIFVHTIRHKNRILQSISGFVVLTTTIQ